MMFGGKTEPKDSYQIIDAAIDGGINFLDTANVYSRGSSEEVTGEALARNGKRDKVFLATKVHGRMSDDDPNMMGNSRRHIIQQCDESLRRLKTDWIDLYQIHRPQSDIPIDETLRALDDLIRAGKVRYIGTSTYAAWQSVEALWASEKLGLNRFVCEQPPYNILDRRIERELLPMARTYGYAIIPWSPLAGGLLTGKYKRNEPAPSGSRFENADKNPRQAARFTEAVFDVNDALRDIAQAKNATVAQVALAWVAQQPGVTSPIIGPRTMEQLTDNLGAAEIGLSDEEVAKIDEIVSPGTAVSPFYEADFGPALYR
jgi:aryl-alcohol dehydrogenase-like predicted oxidoreductase